MGGHLLKLDKTNHQSLVFIDTVCGKKGFSMSRYRHSDILTELIELSLDICGGIRMQLNYYRATVYKQDLAGTINRKVEALRTVSILSGEELLKEPLRDYDVMLENAHLHYNPGECSYTVRCTQLMSSTLEACEELRDQMEFEQQKYRLTNREFSKNIQRNRRKLMSIARKGTRQHIFFSSL
jgi:hypothetical protein